MVDVVVDVELKRTLIRFRGESSSLEISGQCPELGIGERIFLNGRAYNWQEEKPDFFQRVGIFEVTSKDENPKDCGGQYERSYVIRPVAGFQGNDAIRLLVTERDSLAGGRARYIETDHTWGHIQKVI